MKIDPMQLTQQLAQNSQTAAPLFNLIKPVTDEIKKEADDAADSDNNISNADRSTAALTTSAFAAEVKESSSSPSKATNASGMGSKSSDFSALASNWIRA